VKAYCDVCVTSSNVYDIIERYPSDKIVFVPDKLMGKNIIQEMKRRGVNKEIVLYDGTCYVHEEYNPDLIDYFKITHPGLAVVAHPECKEEVAQKSDYVGSTGQMMDFIKKSPAAEFLLLTECGLSSRLQIENPDKKFIGTCQMCKYMKSNSLEGILRVLKNPRPEDEIRLDPETIRKAKLSIDRMFEYAESEKPARPQNPCE
jgi:quinolinate synthase